MENLSVAFKHVSQAVSLDSNGFTQAAFSKYIHSLQVLVVYLNNIFVSSGFENMLEKKKEVLQVLSMVHECSDRISIILKDYEKSSNAAVPKILKSYEEKPVSLKVSAFEKVQKENAQLFKMYKTRLDKTNDKLTKTNLNLEFQRRVAENAVLAKKSYDAALNQLQKERMQFMENEIRKLCQKNEHLNEKEKEKHVLYNKVLQYVKAEMWPCTWKLNSHNLTACEMAEKIFQKIVGCFDHPLTHWLILCHTSIKRKIDTAMKECSEYIPLLPGLDAEFQLKYYSVQEHCDCVVIKLSNSESAVAITTSKMQHLENLLESITSEIKSVIADTLEIFYLVYKSLLPDESETACYYVIEKHLLKPLWPNLSLLYRSVNLASECKLSESMHLHQNCNPCKFGFNIGRNFHNELATMLGSFLQQKSLVMKIKMSVQVSKKICEFSAVEDGSETMLGADEMIPLLSYIILQSRLPQLVSECNMLEHLFDVNYMLGEEGYALSSFLAALKCVEMMKLTECDPP